MSAVARLGDLVKLTIRKSNPKIINTRMAKTFTNWQKIRQSQSRSLIIWRASKIIASGVNQIWVRKARADEF